MKSMANESEVLNLIHKMQVQLFAIDQKLNSIMNRINPDGKPLTVMPNSTFAAQKPQNQLKQRPMYKAICADCHKECEIPFKPSGERPVYCQECFTLRKSGQIPKSTAETKQGAVSITQEDKKEVSKPPAKKKKTSPKKSVTKKKTTKKK